MSDIDPNTILPEYQANDTRLPNYRRRDGLLRTEHVICLKNPHTKRVWVKLKIYSTAKSSSAMPVYKEGDVINGKLELDIEDDAIQQIDMKVRIWLSGETSLIINHSS